MPSSLEGEYNSILGNRYQELKEIISRWAFTAATWMKERDDFEENDLADSKVEGVYYTGSKSHPW